MRVLSRLKPWQVSVLLGFLVALIGVVKYGVGAFPAWVYLFDLSVNWSDPSQALLLEPPADYLLSNFVAAWVAGALGLTTPGPHFAFFVILAVIAIVFPFLMPVIRQSVARSRLLFMAIAGGAILPVLLLWANGYDSVTVIGLSFAALCRNKYLAAIGWFVATLNHTSIGVVSVIAWGVVSLWAHRSPIRVALAGVAVLVAGVLNGMLMDAWGGSTSRLDWFREQTLEDYIQGFFSSMPLVFLGSLGVLWFVLLRPRIFQLGVVKVLITEAIVLSLLLPWITFDTSRTVALSLLAAVLAVVVLLPDLVEDRVINSAWRNIGLVAAVMPMPVIWTGELLYGGWEGFFTIDDSLQFPDWYPVSN